MQSWISTACEKTIWLRALRISLIVGSLLMAINHGDLIITGAMESDHWVKVLLTYSVPFSVSTYSSVASCRVR